MKMPNSPKTKAQAHLNQADTPTMESASVCIFSRVKTNMLVAPSILEAELGQDGGVMLAPRCLELPSH